MPKKRMTRNVGQKRSAQLTDKQQRLLLADPDELIEEDEWLREILEPFRCFSQELWERWAEEWREEHRRSR